jgi:hypothetical protein
MKNKEETESSLEELCPHAEVCAESNYGNREICSSDPETCENYFLFEGGDIMIEKLPQGIYKKSLKTFPERFTRVGSRMESEGFTSRWKSKK